MVRHQLHHNNTVNSKKKPIIIAFCCERDIFAFLHQGSSGVFHCIFWCFVDWLYPKTQLSSPKVICESKESSLLRSFRSVSAINTRACFCSGISTVGTIFKHTFHMLNFCRKIVWTLDLLILVLVATSLNIFQQFWSVHFFTWSREMVFTTVVGLPSQWLSCKDVQPAQKRPTHFFTITLTSSWVPYTDDKSSIIFPFNLYFLIKNFAAALCLVITPPFSIIQKSSQYTVLHFMRQLVNTSILYSSVLQFLLLFLESLFYLLLPFHSASFTRSRWMESWLRTFWTNYVYNFSNWVAW